MSPERRAGVRVSRHYNAPVILALASVAALWLGAPVLLLWVAR